MRISESVVALLSVERTHLHLKHSAFPTPWRTGSLLHDFLHTHLPHDAHLRCEGLCHIALTRVFPYWQPELVSSFLSKEDLVSALVASCHIPVYGG